MEKRTNTFKKKCIKVVFLLVSLTVYAQSQSTDPHDKTIWDRYFEIGFKVNAGYANNYFSLSDLLKKNIIVDIADISHTIKSELNGKVAFDTDFFINLNFEKVRAGLFSRIDADSFIAFDKNIFDFLATGNVGLNSVDLGAGIGAAVYLESGLNLGLRFDKLFIAVSPSYYLPLLHAPYKKQNYNLTYDNEGHFTASGASRLKVYSVLPLKDYMNSSAQSEQFDTASVFKQGGVDITLSAMYALLPVLDIGAGLTHIPIVPAKIINPFVFSVDLNVAMSSIISQLTQNGKPLDIDLTQEVRPASSQMIIRPIRFNIFVNWRPFKTRVFVLSPDLECRFGGAAFEHFFGFGYKLHAQGTFGPFSPFIATSYKDSVFIQKIGFVLNLRVLELDIALSSQSQNFLRSFTGNGIGLTLGFVIGY